MARIRASEEVRRGQILAAAFEVASRDGLAGLTVRAVAAEAEVSHALVLFHFGRKEKLLEELLDWLLSTMSILDVPPEISGLPRALDRLHALLEQEMLRLVEQPARTGLFFEYWTLGARHEPIRTRIAAELERYRAAFRENIEELLRAEPATFAGVTAEALAAVAVSWMQGCALQAMNDPEHFDTGAYLAAVRGLVARLPGAAQP